MNAIVTDPPSPMIDIVQTPLSHFLYVKVYIYIYTAKAVALLAGMYVTSGTSIFAILGKFKVISNIYITTFLER